MGATGLEPVKDSCMNTHVSLLSGAECGAYLNDADLEVVVGAWGKLPSALKAGIVAMVRAADGTNRTVMMKMAGSLAKFKNPDHQ